MSPSIPDSYSSLWKADSWSCDDASIVVPPMSPRYSHIIWSIRTPPMLLESHFFWSWSGWPRRRLPCTIHFVPGWQLWMYRFQIVWMARIAVSSPIPMSSRTMDLSTPWGGFELGGSEQYMPVDIFYWPRRKEQLYKWFRIPLLLSDFSRIVSKFSGYILRQWRVQPTQWWRPSRQLMNKKRRDWTRSMKRSVAMNDG